MSRSRAYPVSLASASSLPSPEILDAAYRSVARGGHDDLSNADTFTVPSEAFRLFNMDRRTSTRVSSKSETLIRSYRETASFSV